MGDLGIVRGIGANSRLGEAPHVSREDHQRGRDHRELDLRSHVEQPTDDQDDDGIADSATHANARKVQARAIRELDDEGVAQGQEPREKRRERKGYEKDRDERRRQVIQRSEYRRRKAEDHDDRAAAPELVGDRRPERLDGERTHRGRREEDAGLGCAEAEARVVSGEERRVHARADPVEDVREEQRSHACVCPGVVHRASPFLLAGCLSGLRSDSPSSVKQSCEALEQCSVVSSFSCRCFTAHKIAAQDEIAPGKHRFTVNGRKSAVKRYFTAYETFCFIFTSLDLRYEAN